MFENSFPPLFSVLNRLLMFPFSRCLFRFHEDFLLLDVPFKKSFSKFRLVGDQSALARQV